NGRGNLIANNGTIRDYNLFCVDSALSHVITFPIDSGYSAGGEIKYTVEINDSDRDSTLTEVGTIRYAFTRKLDGTFVRSIEAADASPFIETWPDTGPTVTTQWIATFSSGYARVYVRFHCNLVDPTIRCWYNFHHGGRGSVNHMSY
ncbi:unnamed protein product, partial [marine sediment metagenome]